MHWRKTLGFSLGHVLNDLTASLWFTYLLLYLNKVLGLSTTNSGLLFLIGQIADGVSTTFVGVNSDAEENHFWLCIQFGNRKAWHILGTLSILGSFPFIFIVIDTLTQEAKVFYYAMFIIIFQFGWASIQISHLSMIPSLTSDSIERTELTAKRYTFTVLSNMTVFSLTAAFFGVFGKDDILGPQNYSEFRNVMLIVVFLGLLASCVFYASIHSSDLSSRRCESVVHNRMSNSHWFREKSLYQVGAVYLTTRLFVNVTQVYMPLYIQSYCEFHPLYLALIPMMTYISGFLVSFTLKSANQKVGKKIVFISGCILSLLATISLHFGNKDLDIYSKFGIFAIANLLGIGGSIMLVNSLALTADYIGENSESSGFIYGIMSLIDKFANGIAIMVIQAYTPREEAEGIYIKEILFSVGSTFAILAILSILTLTPGSLGTRRNRSLEDFDERSPLL